VLIDIKKATDVSVSPEMAWAFLRDVPRFGACVPKATQLTVLQPDRQYTAVIVDRIGPFGIQVERSSSRRPAEPSVT
jgi:carbon monoxide dehydrogenase subunit G